MRRRSVYLRRPVTPDALTTPCGKTARRLLAMAWPQTRDSLLLRLSLRAMSFVTETETQKGSTARKAVVTVDLDQRDVVRNAPAWQHAKGKYPYITATVTLEQSNDQTPEATGQGIEVRDCDGAIVATTDTPEEAVLLLKIMQAEGTDAVKAISQTMQDVNREKRNRTSLLRRELRTLK